MMDCDTFLAEYSAYRDDELSWAERESFEAHLDECFLLKSLQRQH